MKTLIAIPCMDNMPTEFVKSLLYMEKGPDVNVCFNADSLVYDSRNLLSITAIQEKFDAVLWLDSDMVLPVDTLRKLREDLEEHPEIDMVTGLYVKRKHPITPVLYSELEEPGLNRYGRPEKRIKEYTDYPQNELFPVKGCGFGCCMTRVSLLKAVWDKYGPAFAPYPWAGEDIAFCHRVNQLGKQIWCDSRVSCGHVGRTIYHEGMLTPTNGR